MQLLKIRSSYVDLLISDDNFLRMHHIRVRDIKLNIVENKDSFW